MITLRARQHHVHVRRLLDLDESEWPTASVNNQNLLQANMFIASVLLDVIDVYSLHGMNFLSNTDQATLNSRHSFLAKIKQLNIIKSGAEER